MGIRLICKCKVDKDWYFNSSVLVCPHGNDLDNRNRTTEKHRTDARYRLWLADGAWGEPPIPKELP